MDALVFEVGDWQFAIPASAVEQIAPLVEIEPVPGAPEVVEGVIDVHGRLVAVFGLRRRFGLPERPGALWDHLILARAGERVVAIHADRVVDFTRLPDETLEPVERLTAAAPGIGALARTPSGVLLVHDPATFLTDGEAEALAHALSQANGRAGARADARAAVVG